MSVGSIPTILFFDPGIGIAEFSRKRGRVIQLYDLSSPNSVLGATIEMLTHHARNRLIDKRRSPSVRGQLHHNTDILYHNHV